MVRPSRNTPMVPQTISTGRLASARPIPSGSGRQPGFWRRGSGHRTARATNETTRTIAAAQPNSHSVMGRSDRTEIPCPIRNTGASPGFDYEARDQRLAAGVLRVVALHLEFAFEIRCELEARRLPRLQLLLDVVAVQMDVIGRVSADHDEDGVALRRVYLLGAARDLPAPDLDKCDHRRGRSRLLGIGFGRGAGLALGVRSGLRGGVAPVIAAWACNHERDHGHDQGGEDQPYALIPRHRGGKYG